MIKCYTDIDKNLKQDICRQFKSGCDFDTIIKMYPGVKSIIDIGGEDAKIIIVNDGVVVDYAINTSCNAGCGSFISYVANKLNIDIKLRK